MGFEQITNSFILIYNQAKFIRLEIHISLYSVTLKQNIFYVYVIHKYTRKESFMKEWQELNRKRRMCVISREKQQNVEYNGNRSNTNMYSEEVAHRIFSK